MKEWWRKEQEHYWANKNQLEESILIKEQEEVNKLEKIREQEEEAKLHRTVSQKERANKVYFRLYKE